MKVFAVYVNNKASDPDIFTDKDDAVDHALHLSENPRVRKVVVTETHTVFEFHNEKYISPKKKRI
jgi:hypothetical protein